jgi:bacterioferritin-associated ferredoxin
VYACICAAVSVDEVHVAIDGGADTIEAIGETTEAGTSCGSCHDHLDELIESRCTSCPLASLVA